MRIQFYYEKMEEMIELENLGVDGSIIPKWTLEN
jgi:hypothetical protein